jgi:hypothetical protein
MPLGRWRNVNPKEENLEEDVKAAISFASTLPSPVLKFLYFYRFSALKQLKSLSEAAEQFASVNRDAGSARERIRKIEEHLNESERLIPQLERIERYLGHRKTDTRIEEQIGFLEGAKFVRALIQAGVSDEKIAAWLRHFTSPRSKGKLGRPAGTMDSEGYALRALVLYDRNPKMWSYPKLADGLPKCKHKRHTADSKCVDKLKKAVTRLRAFLQELGYEQAGK